jgi:hypothetical protein
MSISRDSSPIGSEISVGSPSPPPSESEKHRLPDNYFQPLKRLKSDSNTIDEDNNNHCNNNHSDASRTSSLKSIKSIDNNNSKSTENSVHKSSFSIADILGRDNDSKSSNINSSSRNSITAARETIVNSISQLHHQHQQHLQQQAAVARIVRPWDVHLQHPISIRPLLPPALLHYEQRLAMEYHQQLQEHFHAQAQLLRHMNVDIIPSESGSDRSSSVASGDCCSPDIGRSSENSTRSNQNNVNNQQKSSNSASNKSPNGTPLDALFQLSNKNFDEAVEEGEKQ